jgi:hypothetical protein
MGLLIACSVVFLCYYIPKKLGYPVIGKILGGIATCFFLYQFITEYFADELFSKNDAIELLNDQDIHLNDDFKIEENKTSWAIGDYYHTFTLNISEKDKNRIIQEVKESPDYKDSTNEITQLLYSSVEKTIGKRFTQNYETKYSYIREYYEENGEGIAPTFRSISIEKSENKLVFEDIDN